MFYRETWAEIQLDALGRNIDRLRLSSGKEIFAVIKANGYGHGDDYIARKAMEHGVKMLAVSSMDEALALRKKHINAPILSLGFVHPRDAHEAAINDVRCTVTSLEWIEQASILPHENLIVHIKVDTGMNRIGVKSLAEVNDILTICDTAGITVEGIFTHFSSSDVQDNLLTQQQYDKFVEILSGIKREFKWIHCANSDATVHFYENVCNAVRCGLAMYGYSSYKTSLEPVMTLFTKIIHVNQVHPGETVSYGATYSPKETEWIATIPIGYADGWNRKHQGDNAFVNNSACEFVGRVCMDQSMIRLDKYYPVGTVVELLGEHCPLIPMANRLDTIPYEVLTQLSDRIPKVYIENNRVVGSINPRLASYH